jgi:hypothetical protein
LSPTASYDEMTKEIAAVIKWVQANSKVHKVMLNKFCYGTLCWRASSGCNESNMVLMLRLWNNIKRCSRTEYERLLGKNPPTAQYDYLATWTNNPENWKAASPIYFIDKIRLFLIYVGEQTYGSIKLQTINF